MILANTSSHNQCDRLQGVPINNYHDHRDDDMTKLMKNERELTDLFRVAHTQSKICAPGKEHIASPKMVTQKNRFFHHAKNYATELIPHGIPFWLSRYFCAHVSFFRAPSGPVASSP